MQELALFREDSSNKYHIGICLDTRRRIRSLKAFVVSSAAQETIEAESELVTRRRWQQPEVGRAARP